MAFKAVLVVLALSAYITLAIPLEPVLSQPDHDYRIVGGAEAQKGSAPHMVALVYGTTIISLTCGGSLVSDRHVLTAAHCITPFVTWTGQLLDSLTGVVGTNSWNSRDKRIHFSDFINHPDYDSWFIKHDVGVLTTREKIKTSESVAIIPLDFDWVDGGVDSYATGWGRIWSWGPIPDELQVLDLRTLSGQECIEGVLQASQELGWAPPVHPSVEICTYHSPNHGMCNGDSGSALVDKQTGKQIGIVSWGFPCARGAPDVFGRISGFKHFLKPILGHT